jgi:hypothetical protein
MNSSHEKALKNAIKLLIHQNGGCVANFLQMSYDRKTFPWCHRKPGVEFGRHCGLIGTSEFSTYELCWLYWLTGCDWFDKKGGK